MTSLRIVLVAVCLFSCNSKKQECDSNSVLPQELKEKYSSVEFAFQKRVDRSKIRCANVFKCVNGCTTDSCMQVCDKMRNDMDTVSQYLFRVLAVCISENCDNNMSAEECVMNKCAFLSAACLADENTPCPCN